MTSAIDDMPNIRSMPSSPTRTAALLPVPALQVLPQPVVLRSENLGPGQGFAEHTHRWNQFVYATAGTLLVTVAHARYVITPEQAIWIPTGTRHATHALHGAAFRNLYVDDAPDLGLPALCTSYAVSPLMRALIVELEQAAGRQEDAAYLHTLYAMLRAQLQRLPQLQRHLPWPHSPRLRQMCEALYAHPSDPRSLHAWGQVLGMSARTLARHFAQETGTSLRQWRQQLRLLLALEWLSTPRSVTSIAIDLGYAGTSAFSYMFHQATGCTPSQWRSRRAAG